VLGSSGQSSGKVWIEDHPTEGWSPGTVDSVGADGSYIVFDEQGEQFKVLQDKARPVDQACLRGVDDLLSLGDFNEGALLHNCRVRYFRDDIYTGIGGPILISVNPFCALPSLYSEQKQKFYRDRASASNNDLVVPPHLYSVGADAHAAMLGETRNQSIIISGESGAGKTEATKRILAYFANLARTTGPSTVGGMSIEDQVLRANPILEAFGNAKTVRNDNSSRFGKYIDIEFDNGGKLRSATISNYLLEKVRIVKQQPNERGYHAFYQLCAGAASSGLNSMLHLQSSSSHTYTSGCTDIVGVDDAEMFQEMTECMDSLGFTTEEKNSVFKITAAVVHLGDMEFALNADSQDGCKICDTEMAEKICQMLGVQSKDFTKVFQFKTLEDPFTKKIIDMPQDESGSSNTRHSMAKTVYSRLFDWLVWRINQSTMSKGGSAKTHKIGILDIYGFEVFEWNSFEQLCINFANEKLQQHFNSHMFTLEQQLYTEEGITWSHITWQDNREIIDALEKKPLGLFCIVDSECLMPNAKDETCLNKIYNSFKTSKIVYKPSRFASSNFAVAHYAGEVIYDIVSFLEKNTDKLHQDIMNLLKLSSMPLLKSLFTDARFAPELAVAGAGAKAGAKAKPMGRAGTGDTQRAKQNVTVSMMFRQQLDQLVEDLNRTNPRYIRCIKPNPNKQAHEFDSLDVQRQLRCAGMLESIRIRRAGYSVRRPFKEFFNRFRVLCPSITAKGNADPDYKELSKRILAEMEAKFEREKNPVEAKSWQVGRSKVFLKEDLQGRLESSIGEALKSFVIRIQKRYRGFVLKKRYRAMRKAAGLLQASLRTLRAVTAYRAEKARTQACLTLQASFRMAVLRLAFVRRRAGALRIQRTYRGWATRQKVGKLKGKMAADRIQKMREDEAQKKAWEAVKNAGEEKEKAMEEMKKQMALDRTMAHEEMQKQIEEAKAQAKGQQAAKAQEDEERQAKAQQSTQEAGKVKQLEEELVAIRRQNARLQGQLDVGRSPDMSPERSQESRQQVDKLKQEMLELRKENARLQGQLECQGSDDKGGSASDAELEQLRRELQEMRRDKVRLEVDLATAKSSEEYDALSSEACQLREECSALRRDKLDTELQLEQRSSQLEAQKAQASHADQVMDELTALRSVHDELQVDFQRVQAQKSALEERGRGEEAARGEFRELRLEKIRLEGELETSKMKEAAITEKFRNQERASHELQTTKQKALAFESELDMSKRHVTSLRDQVDKLTKEGNSGRANALESLRGELMQRIEAKPRPSFLPQGGCSTGDGAGEGFGDTQGERKTLLDQRAMFEKLRQQFIDAKASAVEEQQEVGMADPGVATELELEEEIRQLRKENVDLNIRIESLHDEIKEKRDESSNMFQSSGILQAEVEDLKMQLEHESNACRRQGLELAELQERIVDADARAASSTSRLLGAEEARQRAEEDAKAAQLRARRAEEELPALERRAQQLQEQVGGAQAAKQALAAQVEEQRAFAEQCRSGAEQTERRKIELESNLSWLESENERLKAETQDAISERDKIKQVVDELVRADQENRSEELKREVDKYKARASYFEREYGNSKQLNGEMTKLMSQMTQAVAERTDEKGDVTAQNRLLKNQLETRAQELRTAKLERDEAQKQLDALQSQGRYYQDKYRETQEELRGLKQEHSISAATSSKLKLRVESLQREAEDNQAQNARLQYQARALGDDVAKIDRYEQHVQELQSKLKRQDEELQNSQAFAAKSQAVNDCLNTLLVLESEQTSLYETTFSVQDSSLLSQFDTKKSKAQSVIGRLNQLMTEEERPSIAFMDNRYR